MAQINKPSNYFNTLLWTGNGNSTRSITGVGFQPDLVWLKGRSIINDHTLYDSVRGAGLNKELSSDGTEAEGGLLTEQYGYISSIDSDGFSGTAGVSGSDPVDYFNESGSTYVSWNWLASNTTASNTDGSITSTVSANTISGFSIVSYTGTGANATVGHGLGVAPKVIIIKNRIDAVAWEVGHDAIGWTKKLRLNATDSATTDSGAFNNTAPTSSVFSLGFNNTSNDSGDGMIAYCFAEKKGFSKFGSYIGNGSTDGTFVYTGFKPAFVMIRNIDAIQDWYMLDNKRDTSNLMDIYLRANSSGTEATFDFVDFLSNGFKCRNSASAVNSANTFIYMAFAESPLVGTNNTPATAR